MLLFILSESEHTAPAPSAGGEVDSNGLNCERKAESTIGRKIKIIKTNSNFSQRNQFHNFSVSLNFLPRLCSIEHRSQVCIMQTQVHVWRLMLAYVCLWGFLHVCMFVCTHVCFMYVKAHMNVLDRD